MTVDDLRVLVDNLDEYIHIPGGIERLKKTVLHLAVSGQLVPQNPTEGTGAELYKDIQTTKAKLVSVGKLKKQKELPEITDEPFAIPASWKWVNLADIVEIKIGKTPSRTEPKFWGNDVPWVSIADLSDNNHISETKEKISNQGLEKSFKGIVSPAGTLLYSFKLTIGKMSIIDMDAVHNEAIASLVAQSPVTTEYLFKALKIIDPQSKTNSAVMGKTLNSQSLAVIEVPLPPLAEQQRIVAKVDEIFALIDRLSVAYQAEETERSAFVRSSLRSLSHDGSQLALENLASTIRTKADAAELRKAILHLAVSGQLVPQNPTEGTGAELYKDIQTTKAKLITEGKLKKQKPLPPITAEEIPFAIPESWEWVRLGELGTTVTGKTPSTSKHSLTEGDVPFVGPGNISKENILTGDYQKWLTNDASYSSEIAQVGDVLMVCIGGSIGKAALVGDKLCFNQQINKISPIKMNSHYLMEALTSGYFQKLVIDSAVGGATPIINQSRWAKLPIPLPPPAEQTRIAQKTTHLLNLVTELEKHLEK